MRSSVKVLLAVVFLGIGVLLAWWFVPTTDSGAGGTLPVATNSPTVLDNSSGYSIADKPSPDTQGKPPLDDAVMQQQRALLKSMEKKISTLQSEVDRMNNAPPSDEGSRDIESEIAPQLDVEQQKRDAELTLQSTVQHLEHFVQVGQVDESRMGGLQQRIGDAFLKSSIAVDAAVKSAHCSSALCKFEVQGQSSEGADVVMSLQEHNVFGDGTEVLVVPGEGKQWTIYVGPEGKDLPKQPQM